MALTYQQAVEQTITGAEQFHEIINGSATSEVVVEDGSKIPSVRKALLDNFYYKDPIDWQQGQNELVFNQIRKFTDGTWWIAPTATATNPVVMGVTPYGDPLWKVFSWDRVIDSQKANRKLIERSWAEAGYNVVAGSFQEGATLNTTTDVIINYGADFGVYSWVGTLPKVVPANSTVTGTGGVTPTTWVSKITDTLRSQIISGSFLTSDMSSFEQVGAGSTTRTAQDKMRERITPQDKGAVGDGVTNDQAAFDALEASFSNQVVDLMGKTYLVTSIPTGNRYANGYFKVGSSTFKAVFDTAPKFGSGRVVSGEGALASLPDDYDIGVSGLVVAIGKDTMGKATQVKKAIAIGPGAMSESIIIRDDIAIGEDALKFIQSESPDQGPFHGTRMFAGGSNAFRFATTANRGVAIGRNAAQAVTTSINVTATGANALSSYCPIDWTGEITNPTPVTADGITAYGADTLALCDGVEDTAIGVGAGQNIKKGDGNYFGGAGAGRLLDSDLSNANKVLNLTVRTGTYTVTGTTVVVDVTGVSAVVGNRVRLRATTGPLLLSEAVDVVVTSAPSANQFTFTCPVAFSGYGNIEITQVETATTRTPSRWNLLCGARAGELATSMQECAFNGYSTGKSFNGTAGTFSGWNAGVNMVSGTKVSGFGHQAMRFMQDGSNATSLTNSTCLGANSRVSGDNQVQLGDALTTTYVYGTVQNRSDINDKIDVRDTELGIEFIMGLRPVDGRWDMRDDYIEEYQVQVGIDDNAEPVFETRIRQLPKDGSKARSRFHHWFIAQEVKELCDELGVDFGGYQDHSVNGGCDVKTLGYDEFIPPTVKAVQQCWTRLDELEDRIAKLEK